MYYVVSGGFHPFGDDLRHQANIAAGDYSLSALQGDGQLAEIYILSCLKPVL